MEEKKTLNQKLCLIQTELKAPKDMTNDFGKYKYRSCESILMALKPLEKKYDCFVTLNDEVVQIGDRYYVCATATITSDGEAISVKAWAREVDKHKNMDEAQTTGAASSYARKYALNGLFAIDDTKDSDYLNDGKTETVKTETTKVAAPSYTQADIEAAIANVNACTTTAEVAKIWNELSALKGDVRFSAAITKKGKELKAKENGTKQK